MKTAVITGATSGIGLAVTKTLAAQGYAVVGVGRSEEKCEAAKKQIEEKYEGAVVKYFVADLAQQTQIKKLAQQAGGYIDENFNGRLDVLVNNAGGVRDWYTTTNEGYETQFALNHLAGFLLTYLMMPRLEKAKGKMILTGSDSHKYMNMRWDDIMFKKHYSCLYAYKQSKLSNLLFAKEFNKRLAGSGVKAYVVDPGLVKTDIGIKGTSGIVSWFWSRRSKHGADPSVSAQTYAYISNEPNLSGMYYYRCEQKKYHKNVDKQDAARLWELSEKLCGIDYSEAVK